MNYYGPHSNGELLRRYGYVTPKHSRYDVVELPWDLVRTAYGKMANIDADVMEKLVSNCVDHFFLNFLLIKTRRQNSPPRKTSKRASSLNEIQGILTRKAACTATSDS